MINFTQREGKYVGDLKFYALSTCGWCRKTKEFLDGRGIGYSFIDVDLATPHEQKRLMREQRKYNPAGSFPTIVVDGGADVIIGYDEDKLNQLAGAVTV